VTMKPIMKTILVVFVPAIIAGLPASTHAQAPAEAEMARIEEEKKEASTLFKEATALMDDGHYAEACPKLVESRRLNPKPGTLYVLAECEFALDRTLTAKSHYYAFLAMVRGLPEDQRKNYETRADNATNKLIEMERSIPRIRFVIPPNWNPNTIVRVDGIVFSFGALQNSHQVDPGDHVVATQLKGGPVREEHYTVKKGEEWVLLLRVDEPPAIPAPIRPPLPTNSPNVPPQDFWDIVPPSALLLGGTGAASAIIGAWVLATGDESSRASGTVLTMLGVAGIAIGTIIVVTKLNSRPPTPQNAWIRPEISASPQGVSFILHGAF
jgi:hypothetical protein